VNNYAYVDNVFSNSKVVKMKKRGEYLRVCWVKIFIGSLFAAGYPVCPPPNEKKETRSVFFRPTSKVILIWIALYHELLTCKALRYGTCKQGITQCYLPPTRLSTSALSYTCLYSPTAELHSPLAGTHFHHAEGRRLSWPGWLVTYRDGIPA